VDIGGTNQSVALALAGEAPLLQLRRQTPPGGTALDVLANVVEMLREGIAEAHRFGRGGDLAAIGVGFGGPVDLTHGVVIDSHHVPGWTGFPLRDRLSETFGVPVALDNDANAAALGEAVSGAGRGHAQILYVNIGTGIGGGIVLDGRIYHGRNGLAGEIGHVTVLPGGPRCDCGKRGCLEAVASGRSIGRLARERVRRAGADAVPLLDYAGGDVDTLDSKHVFRAAAEGNALAIGLIDEIAGYLGMALGNAVNLLDPSAIVVGGGVSETGKLLFAPLRRALAAHLLPSLPVPAIVPAALGYDAGVLGALALSF
jgi:glucokinase